MAEWRKRKGVAHDTWHKCRNCSNDPKANYDVRNSPPTSGEECDECKGKIRANNCRES